MGEERLRISSAEATARDDKWKLERQRWFDEKSEAEKVIRTLLVDLGLQHREATVDVAIPVSSNQIHGT
ncbi:MAG: hypothetical protein FJ267_06850 [Planctomycetes bacterium]|nr:hypothetical protein [Planctomycetota bacterium]